MSKRSTHAKKIGKLRKSLRRTPTRYIDLVQWLELRGYANTAGGARKLLTDGKVMVDSHVVGRTQLLEGDDATWIAQPLIKAEHRDRIIVAS